VKRRDRERRAVGIEEMCGSEFRITLPSELILKGFAGIRPAVKRQFRQSAQAQVSIITMTTQKASKSTSKHHQKRARSCCSVMDSPLEEIHSILVRP
jgi:hypothetical protein